MSKLSSTVADDFVIPELNTEWTEVEVIDLYNEDGFGLGFGIIGSKSTGVVVRSIQHGSPAYKTGRLRVGDHILYIDTMNVRGFSSEQIASILRQTGPEVRLIVARAVHDPSSSSATPMISTEQTLDWLQQSLNSSMQLASLEMQHNRSTTRSEHSVEGSAPAQAAASCSSSTTTAVVTNKTRVVDFSAASDSSSLQQAAQTQHSDLTLPESTLINPAAAMLQTFVSPCTVVPTSCLEEHLDLLVSTYLSPAILEEMHTHQQLLAQSHQLHQPHIDNLPETSSSTQLPTKIESENTAPNKISSSKSSKKNSLASKSQELPPSEATPDKGVTSEEIEKAALASSHSSLKTKAGKEVAEDLENSTIAPNLPFQVASDMENLLIELEKGERGLGITIAGYVSTSPQVQLNGIFVKGITPNSSAERSGMIRIHDQIVEVNEKPLYGMDNHQAVEILKSATNPVKLKILRYHKGPIHEQLMWTMQAPPPLQAPGTGSPLLERTTTTTTCPPENTPVPAGSEKKHTSLITLPTQQPSLNVSSSELSELLSLQMLHGGGGADVAEEEELQRDVEPSSLFSSDRSLPCSSSISKMAIRRENAVEVDEAVVAPMKIAYDIAPPLPAFVPQNFDSVANNSLQRQNVAPATTANKILRHANATLHAHSSASHVSSSVNSIFDDVVTSTSVSSTSTERGRPGSGGNDRVSSSNNSSVRGRNGTARLPLAAEETDSNPPHTTTTSTSTPALSTSATMSSRSADSTADHSPIKNTHAVHSSQSADWDPLSTDGTPKSMAIPNSDSYVNDVDSDEGSVPRDVVEANRITWQRILGEQYEIITVHLRKHKDTGNSIGFSMRGTIDVDDDTNCENNPHHYVHHIAPGSPAAYSGLRSGDELLEINGVKLYGTEYKELLRIMRNTPQRIRLVCARLQENAVIPGSTDEDGESCSQSQSGSSNRPYTPPVGDLPNGRRPSFATNDSALHVDLNDFNSTLSSMHPSLRAKSDEHLYVPGNFDNQSLARRCRSLHFLEDVAVWSSKPLLIELRKTEKGLGFSIIDYKDPADNNRTKIIVWALVPGGVAHRDGRICPGDWLVFVNDRSLENATLAQASATLKSSPINSRVILGIMKPLILRTYDSLLEDGGDAVDYIAPPSWDAESATARYPAPSPSLSSDQLPPSLHSSIADGEEVSHIVLHMEEEEEEQDDDYDMAVVVEQISSPHPSSSSVDEVAPHLWSSMQQVEVDAFMEVAGQLTEEVLQFASTLLVTESLLSMSSSSNSMESGLCRGASTSSSSMPQSGDDENVHRRLPLTATSSRSSSSSSSMSLLAMVPKSTSTKEQLLKMSDEDDLLNGMDFSAVPPIPDSYAEEIEILRCVPTFGLSLSSVADGRHGHRVVGIESGSDVAKDGRLAVKDFILRLGDREVRYLRQDSHSYDASSLLRYVAESTPLGDHVRIRFVRNCVMVQYVHDVLTNHLVPELPIKSPIPQFSGSDADEDATLTSSCPPQLPLEDLADELERTPMLNIRGQNNSGGTTMLFTRADIHSPLSVSAANQRIPTMTDGIPSLTIVMPERFDDEELEKEEDGETVLSPHSPVPLEHIPEPVTTPVESARHPPGIAGTPLTPPSSNYELVSPETAAAVAEAASVKSPTKNTSVWRGTKLVTLHRATATSTLGITILALPEKGAYSTNPLTGAGCRVTGQSLKEGEEKGVFIKKVTEGSPAYLSGELKPGDRILKVNNVDLSEASHDTAVETIRHAASPVTLLVQSLVENTRLEYVTAGLNKKPLLSESNSLSEDKPKANGEGPSATASSVPDDATDVTDEYGYSKAVLRERYGHLGGEILLIALRRPARVGDVSLGIRVAGHKDLTQQAVFVSAVHQDSLAALDGRIQFADRLLEVNGISLLDRSHQNASPMIRRSLTEASNTQKPYIKLVIQRSPANLEHIAVHAQSVALASLSPQDVDAVSASDAMAEQQMESAATSTTASSTNVSKMGGSSFQGHVIVPPEAFDIFDVVLFKGQKGLGFFIMDGGFDNEVGTYIKQVTPNGTAAQEGTLRKRDRLLAVNSQDVNTMNYEAVLELLRRTQGRVCLTIGRRKPTSSAASSVEPSSSMRKEEEAAQARNSLMSPTPPRLPTDVVDNSEEKSVVAPVQEAPETSARRCSRAQQESPTIAALADATPPRDPRSASTGPPSSSGGEKEEQPRRRSSSQRPAESVVSGGVVSPVLPSVQPGKETEIVIEKQNELGISIVGGVDTMLGAILVHEVHANGAAAKDGRLWSGDRILAVNNIDLRQATHDEAIQALRTTEKSVRLTVFRDKRPLREEDIMDVFTVQLNKSTKRGLGISIVSKSDVGVCISDLVKGGVAEQDGKLQKGDLVLEINGENMRSSTQEQVATMLKRISGKCKLVVGRLKPEATTEPGATPLTSNNANKKKKPTKEGTPVPESESPTPLASCGLPPCYQMLLISWSTRVPQTATSYGVRLVPALLHFPDPSSLSVNRPLVSLGALWVSAVSRDSLAQTHRGLQVGDLLLEVNRRPVAALGRHVDATPRSPHYPRLWEQFIDHCVSAGNVVDVNGVGVERLTFTVARLASSYCSSTSTVVFYPHECEFEPCPRRSALELQSGEETDQLGEEQALDEMTVCPVHEVRLTRGPLGLGLTLCGGRATPHGDLPLFVQSILPGGAAASSWPQLQVGDQIWAINGCTTSLYTLQEATQLLKAVLPGHEVLFKVIRVPTSNVATSPQRQFQDFV